MGFEQKHNKNWKVLMYCGCIDTSEISAETYTAQVITGCLMLSPKPAQHYSDGE